jgi:hypothetical protein
MLFSANSIGAHLLLLQALFCQLDEGSGKVKFLAASVRETTKAFADESENAQRRILLVVLGIEHAGFTDGDAKLIEDDGESAGGNTDARQAPTGVHSAWALAILWIEQVGAIEAIEQAARVVLEAEAKPA